MAPPRSRYSTVILSYRDPPAAVALAGGLLRAAMAPEDLLLVDNGSQDGSVEVLAREFPDVPLLALPENLGFAGGMNRGLERGLAEGREYVALLNDDLELVPGCLERLVEALDRTPDAGLAGAVVRRRIPGHPVANAGASFSPWWGTLGLLPAPDPTRGPRRCDWVSGAALMVRTRAVETAGLLDEDFFLYCEEVEFCLRLARHGWSTVVAPGATVLHEDAGHHPDRLVPLYLQWRNHFLLLRKVMPPWRRPLAYAVRVAQALRDVAGRALGGPYGTLWVPLLGTWHGLLGYTGTRGLEAIRARALSGGSPRTGR